jgi:hypothetical protein
LRGIYFGAAECLACPKTLLPAAKLCRLSMLIIVAGCTTQPNKVANDGPDVQCHSVQTVGSLIAKSVCTTRAQRVAQQAQLDDLRRVVESEAGAPTYPVGQ